MNMTMTEDELIARARTRRNLLFAGTAVVAAAAGAGWSWLRTHTPRPEKWVDDGLWDLRFAKVDGSELEMSSFRGKNLVINFWATWCPPCVKEMPQLDRFHTEYGQRDWQVVGLAIDSPTPVRQFLAKVPVSFAIGLAGLDGTHLSRTFGNDKGALPFSVVLDARGQVRHTRLGETSYEELVQWANQMAS